MSGITAGLALCSIACSVTWAQCDPTWLAGVGMPGPSVGVNATAPLPGGDVLVAGVFAPFAGQLSRNIARFNPATKSWQTVGDGVGSNTGAVYAMVTLPGGDVIVGGSFSSAGGVAASNIARYNPVSGAWSALGTGVNNWVTCMALAPDGTVVVGGLFTLGGGFGLNRIGRYNPSTGNWSPLGAGANDTVNALLVLENGDVVAGGNFTSIGGTSALRVAKFGLATSSWSPLGAGIGAGGVRGLGVLGDGTLVAAGSFPAAVPFSHVLYLAPGSSTWNELGARISGGVNSFASKVAVVNGEVVVGGAFTSAGTLAVNSIAKYSPTTGQWSAFGSGVGGNTTGLPWVGTIVVLLDGSLSVGGGFLTAGGLASTGFGIFGSPCRCVADLDNDGVFANGRGLDGAVTIEDLLFYLAAFEFGDPQADLDNGSGSGMPDGGVDINDLLFFLAHFEGGC